MSSLDALSIREAKAADCPQISGLIGELNKYEGLPNCPHVDASALEEHGFGDRPVFKCLVAVNARDRTRSQEHAGSSDVTRSDVVVGYVLFCYGFDRHGKHVYMEDLYVTPAYRSKGLGTQLWKTILKLGLEVGAQSCRFCVLDWNAPSIAFYKSRGAQDVTATKGFHFFGLTKELLEKCVARKAPIVAGVAAVRAANESDVDEILALQLHLEAGLGEQGTPVTKEELHAAIFASTPSCYVVVAEDHGGALLGYALFSLCFTTWQGLCFEVYEVYVKPDSRSIYVGTHLLQHVMKHCLSLGCLRCDFITAPDSVLSRMLEKMEAVDHTKDEGFLLMFMDKVAMVKMVTRDEREPSQH